MLVVVVGGYLILSTANDRQGSISPIPGGTDTMLTVQDRDRSEALSGVRTQQGEEGDSALLPANQNTPSAQALPGQGPSSSGTDSSGPVDRSASKPVSVQYDQEKTPVEPAAASEMEYGTLSINCLPWARVFIDEEEIGTTPLFEPIRVRSGPHTITCVNPDFAPHVENIRISPNERKQLNVFLVGFLHVNTEPWTTIYIDGDLLDKTPATRMLSPGTHLLRLVRADTIDLSWQETIRIASGETLWVFRSLPGSGEN